MKICIERSDRMGDIILTLPVIQGIKEKHPQAIIHVVASNKNLKICKQFSFIDKIYEKSTSSSVFNNLKKSMSAEQYDYYFTFSPGWFGLRLGFFLKSNFKSSLILKSRYNSNIFSKLGQIIFTKFFYSMSIVIDRAELFKANKNIHQTNMMMNVVEKSGLTISRVAKTKLTFKNVFILKKDRRICVIHLSSKWINKYYSEEDFDDLLKFLDEKKISIYLTTDETTKNKFSKIFDTFDIVENSNEIEKNNNNILICNKFDFENWTSLINQADYVITPESGCTHVASLTNCKLAVIYDADNLPRSIEKEYSPWNKKYIAFKTNDKELNQKLINFI